MSWKRTEALMDTIRHYASFPATGVSLRQMVQFGALPSTGESNPMVDTEKER
jgi:pyruvate dehydrogenase kinase 2/3/4